MIHEILVEEALIGWKEFETEVMRDVKDNCVIICSIENLDPMGVHTGDSITVAPAQTLSDKEWQRLRDHSFAIMREIGVATGGSNIQFAVNPADGRIMAIEMNPRVSRSSALASKATGFPIAKFAAKLAVGYTLDEIPNDITRSTPASFEPTLDYCVVKIPRWAFEKFPGADTTLGSQMKSVGEVMAIGRTFKEALQKALRSLESSRAGLGLDRKDRWKDLKGIPRKTLEEMVTRPNPDRILALRYALKAGFPIEEVARRSGVDPWFLAHIAELLRFEERLEDVKALADAPPDLIREAKRLGYSDAQLAHVWTAKEMEVRARRKALGITPVYNLVDTCAAEFEAVTPYYYSTYETADELTRSDRKRVMILGSGPNRIGQGIEFDYSCVHAAFALKELGYETLMVNSNPETVSTDYDTSDRLFFEPLTCEDVLNVWERLEPEGVIVQLGGQTPLNLARALEAAGVRILGTSPDSIDLAEDRERFRKVLDAVGLQQPESGSATRVEDAVGLARRIGFPVLVRPSYVLGGRAMEIVYDEASLARQFHEALDASGGAPVLIDRFLEEAIEVDVDCLADGTDAVIGGIMEHIEEAGIHSGDSCCVIPSFSLTQEILEEIRRGTYALAKALKVRGLMNVQYAVRQGGLYVLEVNPRASRTVPFVSKAIGVPLAKLAAKIMVGKTLKELGFTREIVPAHISVKEPVFPFSRFPGVDVLLGPEMRSTGEVMGIDMDFGMAMAKAKLGAGQRLPLQGKVFVSLRDGDKPHAAAVARKFHALGFALVATSGTARAILAAGVPVTPVKKIAEGRPNIHDMLLNGDIALVVNTPSGKDPRADEAVIRRAALTRQVPCITTVSGALAVTHGIGALQETGLRVQALQDFMSTTAKGQAPAPRARRDLGGLR
jgi:carbamoyl-phosphate synthase large subunit